jgi:hypothetical protein
MGNTELTRPMTWAFGLERVTGIAPALTVRESLRHVPAACLTCALSLWRVEPLVPVSRLRTLRLVAREWHAARRANSGR